jgi:hypothetical protein
MPALLSALLEIKATNTMSDVGSMPPRWAVESCYGYPIPIIIIVCSYSITDQRRARVRTPAVHKDQREATGSSTSELVLATRWYTDICRTG